MEDRRCLFGLNRSFFWLPRNVLRKLTRDNCFNIVLPISGCFSMTEYRRWRGFVSHVFLHWWNGFSTYENCTHYRVSAYAIHCVAIQNVRPAPTNAVFFPSAQMKNKRYKPNYPIETQAIPARTQSTQTIYRSGDKRPHRNCTNYIPVNPRQPNQPRRSDEPRCAWFRVGMIPKKGVGHSPHPS